MADAFLYTNQDNLIVLNGAALATTDAYVTTGTFAFVLKTSAAVTVSSGTGTYYGVNGRWHATISKADLTALTVGNDYTLTITFDNGSGADGEWIMTLTAKQRGPRE